MLLFNHIIIVGLFIYGFTVERGKEMMSRSDKKCYELFFVFLFVLLALPLKASQLKY